MFNRRNLTPRPATRTTYIEPERQNNYNDGRARSLEDLRTGRGERGEAVEDVAGGRNAPARVQQPASGSFSGGSGKQSLAGWIRDRLQARRAAVTPPPPSAVDTQRTAEIARGGPQMAQRAAQADQTLALNQRLSSDPAFRDEWARLSAEERQRRLRRGRLGGRDNVRNQGINR